MNTTHQPNLPLPVFSREIRLGLVLYGGVSLAVYMNGVCQEFYNAIRGRGVYKLLKALTDSDIVVDIVSGTSAGGVNGVLLSHAIANSNLEEATNFKKFADLWREHGDIQKLLRKSLPKDKNFSVLDGEGFYQERLKAAFQEPTFPSRGDWYSDFGELDLFITATDFNGKINQTFDNVGKVIDVKDHKAFFHLRYRQEQTEYIENPFRIAPDNQIAETTLAKLCRATSCFPVAFPVVTVSLSPEENEKHDTDDIKVDRKLVEWGQLQDRDLDPNYRDSKKNYPIYLIDGGVLDNRPFTYTVETIYGRVAYRPAERVLFYLDPTPDRFFGEVAWKENGLPKVGKVLLESLTGLPSYQSIAKDLRLIEEGNCKVTRYKLLKDTILDNLGSIVQGNHQFSKESIHSKENHQSLEESAYIKCRLLNMLDHSISKVLVRKSPFEMKQDHQRDFLAKTAEILKDLKDLKDVQKITKIYHNVQPLDVSFFIRKYNFLLDRIAVLSDQKIQKISLSNSPHSGKLSSDHSTLRQFVALRYLSYQISWQLELLKLIQKSLDRILNYYDFSELAGAEDFSQFNIERIYHFLIVFHRTLLNTNFKHNPQDSEEPSSGDLLIAYYEFFKKIHFPREIDFDNDNVNWSNLKLLLPEQESSVSKKIFEQIYQLPLCKVLTLQGLRDKKQEINRIKRVVQQCLSSDNARKDEYNWSEVNISIAENLEIVQVDLASIDPQDMWDQDSTILPVIEQNSRSFIDSLSPYIDRKDKQELQRYFKDFESIDKILYSYEYLSDIVTKNTIKLARISPRDADKGYGAEFLDQAKKETPPEKNLKSWVINTMLSVDFLKSFIDPMIYYGEDWTDSIS
jgi:patatin-related protein